MSQYGTQRLVDIRASPNRWRAGFAARIPAVDGEDSYCSVPSLVMWAGTHAPASGGVSSIAEKVLADGDSGRPFSLSR